MEQIDIFANFIMNEIDGEPSRSEGAGDCAIRIIRQLEIKLENAEVAQSNAEVIVNVLENVLHKVCIQATRHKRATDEREYLISDLEIIEKMTGWGDEAQE